MNFGDVVDVDFGTPIGSEAGFLRPAIVCTSDSSLRFGPTTIFVVPVTSTHRSFPSHVRIEPDEANRLDTTGFALVEQMRAISSTRCSAARGNVGAAVAWQLTDVLAMIIGIP